MKFITINDRTPPAVRKMLEKREKRFHGLSQHQREMEVFMKKLRSDEAKLDPQLRILLNQHTAIDVKCPSCGESTRGNKVNGVPYCFKCRLPVQKNKSNSPKIRIVSKEETMRYATFKKI